MQEDEAGTLTVLKAQRPFVESPQVVLDYKKEDDRDEIQKILSFHFSEGRMDSTELVELLSNPKADPRILNINPVVVGAHLGSYKRWGGERDRKPDREHEEGDGLDERMEALEGRFDQRMQNVESGIQRAFTLFEKLSGTIGIEGSAADEGRTTPGEQAQSSEELRERKQDLAEMQNQLRVKKEGLGLTDEIDERIAPIKEELRYIRASFEASKEIVAKEREEEMQEPEPKELTEEESQLKVFEENVEKYERHLEFVRKKLQMASRGSKALKGLKENTKKLRRVEKDMEKIGDLISTGEVPGDEEIPDFEIEEDEFWSDCFRVLKWCQTVMPESFENILNRHGGRNREIIRKKLEAVK
ncbi:MAG: hypothetical protein KAW39_01215 [Thermoplasmata archaeon]|nr:hypothetical protein [Thermoplasmata archaeon]